MFEKSIDDYNEAIRLDPNFVLAIYNKGNSYAALGNHNEAVKSYSELMQIDKNHKSASYNRGNSYYYLQLFDKAVEDYSHNILLNPTHSLSYYNRGMSYLKLENYDNATVDFLQIKASTRDQALHSLADDNLKEIARVKKSSSYKFVSSLVDKVKDVLVFNDRFLTHYTSLSTLRFLVFKDSPLWISEASFLNDPSEGKSLFEFLGIDSGYHKRTRNMTDVTVFVEQPYIGSFVAEGKSDDLTLWRMYGKEDKEEVKGCSITFDSEVFLKDLRDKYFPNELEDENENYINVFNFFRVAYFKLNSNLEFIIPGIDFEQQTILNSLLTELKNFINGLGTNGLNNEDERWISEKLSEIAFLFKSVEYQYEHEVRLVINQFKPSIDLTRSENYNLLPRVYLESVSIIPSLHKITLGPKVNLAEEWAAALHYFIKSHYIKSNRQQTEIRISHLPYK